MIDRNMGNVILIAMPSAAVYRPHLGISLLKAELAGHLVPAGIRYLNMLWARYCFDSVTGPVDSYAELQQRVSSRIVDLLLQRNENAAMVEDWIFAQALHGQGCLKDSEYIHELLAAEYSPDEISVILALRDKVPGFLDECMRAVPWAQYAVAGFTSTYAQQVSSLALAKRVKACHPSVKIVFGGANCEGPMGIALLRHFSFVDYVASGEADLSFPALLAALDGNEPDPAIPGIVSRRNGEPILHSSAPPVRDMDSLPNPDYADFFDQYRDQPYAHLVDARVPLEQSRGCWWGVRSHCAFCGLNGQTMGYRAKSPARARRDLLEMKDLYHARSVEFADNILHLDYYQTLLPELAGLDHGIELFYEIKSNVKKPQVELLRSAGVTTVQPGIESFSTAILQLMGKGCTALQNIQCLKWCLQFGIRPEWNLLYGFPGEDPAEYEAMLSTLEAITHFRPPRGFSRIRMDRFSPNFNQAAARGFRDVRAQRPYFHLHPFSESELQNLAYFFDFNYADGRDPDTYVRPIQRFVDLWKAQDDAGALIHVPVEGGGGLIDDTRFNRRRPWFELPALENRIYSMCDEAKSFGQIASRLAPEDAAHSGSILLDFVANRLMVREGDRFLSLAPTKTADVESSKFDLAADLLAIRT